MNDGNHSILFFGATGILGSRILNEAAARGHSLTAVVRDKDRAALQAHGRLQVEEADLLNFESWRGFLAGKDTVISAFGPAPGSDASLHEATLALCSALGAQPELRLIAVGGAGSLTLPSGDRLVDAPDFPPAYRTIALAHARALDFYQATKLSTRWTNICPPAMIEPGSRTGQYRTALDELVCDEAGESKISCEDFAVAIIDELETPRHLGRRFAVGN